MQTPDENQPTDAASGSAAQVEHPEVVQDAQADGREQQSEAVEQPAKVMRIGSMIKLLLEEVRQSDADLDEPSRDRLREIYETSVTELATALSPDLRDELGRLAHPFAGTNAPSEGELRIAKAQLVGWLEGLFHGIQATLFAQQMAARQQLDDMRRRLPPGASPMGGDSEARPGTYL
ncbi:MAG TPA: proteasome activator [Acidimicrobiales bacterium]|nr:proteasome activator [Acidimicrobiales bacterium]